MHNTNDIEVLRRALIREKAARKQAEEILERKSFELYESNKKLIELNEHLENELEDKMGLVLTLSKFPEQNPNPVLRMSFEFEITYKNTASELFLQNIQKTENNSGFKRLIEIVKKSNRIKASISEELLTQEKAYLVNVLYLEELSSYSIYVTDISSRVEITKILKKNEEQLRHLFENNPFPMLIYDYESLKIVELNKPAQEFYGLKNNIIGTYVNDLHPSEEKEKAIETQSRVLKGLPIEFREWFHRSANDIYRPVELHSSEIDYLGRRSRLLLINDVTERKKIQIEKEINQKQYQDLVEGASDIIFRSNTSGDFVYVNPTAVRVSGYSEKELLSMNYLDLVCEECYDRVKSFYERQIEQEEQTTYLEFAIKTKAGKRIWLGQNVNIQNTINGEIEINALARDITELEMARKSLERSEKKYRNILENLKLGILEVDLDDRVTKVYPKFSELSGYSEEELLGTTPLELLLPPEHRATMTRQNVLRAQGIGSVYEVEIITKSGERKWVIISGAPFYDEQGEIAGTVGIHLDINDRKRIEKELRIAKDLAENSVKLKEMFMANMSHEIRTPMNAILGMSRLLTRTDLTEKQKEYVTALTFSAENLLVIINDILDFSKIEAGAMVLHPEPENLRTLCNDIIKLFLPKADEKDLILNLDDSKLKNSWYLIDKTRLNQVITNLIGNAIKFTDFGEVTLMISSSRIEDNKDLVRFSVVDTGIGISSENHSKIFESFIQADDTIESNYGGTGLGLPISKKIVEKMGGVLMFESEYNKGSCFYFEVNLDRTEDIKEVRVVDEVLESQDYRGYDLLLVEDNEINIFMAQTILEELGFNVTISRNGKEAIENLKHRTFDLVLMDVRMPEMDGITATRIIRDEMRIDLPIVALTANALREDKEKCIDAGMNNFLTKPFEREALLAVISNLLKTHKKLTRPENKFLVDMSNLDIVVSGNNEFKTKMIELFILESRNELLRLESAIESENWTEISEVAHKLKPSLDYLATSEIRESVRYIESKFKEPNPENHLIKLKDFMFDLQLLREQLTR